MRRTHPSMFGGERRTWVLWIAVALWMAGTAWASLSRSVTSPPGTDVWLHGLTYSAFTLLLASALRRRDSQTHPIFAGAIAWGYGLVMEGAQALTPYRAAEARDVLANAIGCGAAVLLAVVVRR